ncbi:MAG TPA: homoserine O-acetyltransferase [Microbacteriaceae bacterium]|nr:homoserine O-acetyltransferase [Microbacteriaceae bacterium]
MDWQTTADVRPSHFVTDADERAARGKAPATGAWREGDPVGARRFAPIGEFTTEAGATLPHVRIAYETFGTLNADASNAVLVFHALTGDSHVARTSGTEAQADGWWQSVVGPGLAINTDEWFVVCPNVLGGCQGSTGPASLSARGTEWGSRFPHLTIRDQVRAFQALGAQLGIARWSALIGGSMGGMHALEWAVTAPETVARLAVLAAPPATSADQIAHNSVQIEAVRSDVNFNGGDYYDAPIGAGPTRGLALARRMAMLNYRTPGELNDRFDRRWQSTVSPLGDGGRFAVESYLDFHGNKFTRRFDANSYIVLTEAMNSHDIARDRGSVAEALSRLTMPTLVLGITSDRYFSVDGQFELARHIPGNIHGDDAVVVDSEFGHDAFLIESEAVGHALQTLLSTPIAAPVTH